MARPSASTHVCVLIMVSTWGSQPGHQEAARLQDREDAAPASDVLLYAVSWESSIPYEAYDSLSCRSSCRSVSWNITAYLSMRRCKPSRPVLPTSGLSMRV